MCHTDRQIKSKANLYRIILAALAACSLAACALSPTLKQPATYTPDPVRLTLGAPTSNPFFTKTPTRSASTPIAPIPNVTQTILAIDFTSTPVPTETKVAHTPRPTPNDGSLFHEDFSDELSGWDRNTKNESTADYADGRYRLFVAGAYQEIWANPGKYFPDGISITVDAALEKGPEHSSYGILCGYVDVNNYFALTVGPDGFVEIFRRINGERTTLFEDTLKTGIKPKTNQLEAVCSQQTMTLLVNGKQVGQAIDPLLPGGDVGLIAGSFDEEKVEVYFDNLIVRPLAN